MSENQAISSQASERGFFSKLANGDFGLAKTYWVYGVLVSIALNITFKLISSYEVVLIGLAATIAYSVPLYMGIWRAASKYPGNKIWSVLAKIATILGVIMVVFSFAILVKAILVGP